MGHSESTVYCLAARRRPSADVFILSAMSVQQVEEDLKQTIPAAVFGHFGQDDISHVSSRGSAQLFASSMVPEGPKTAEGQDRGSAFRTRS